MTECLCPRCGFVWEHDGIPPSDELKAAVLAHLEGKFDSVVGAMVAGPRFQNRMRAAQAMCDPNDLKRFQGGATYVGPLAEGMIFVWGPFNPFASELVRIAGVRTGQDGIEFNIHAQGDQRPLWNLEQLVREQVVRTPLKVFPA